jgi:glycosyltransferase involved in cell wall biosynthesis
VPLGFDLSAFTDDTGRAERRAALRGAWGVAEDDELITLVARLVPIKRVDRFLRVARLLADRPAVRFAIVGDGELREQLAASPNAGALGERVIWAGFRRDIADVCFASDIVMLTSDNEGTPVSLIEAQAAAVPVIGTDVGGVRSAVKHGLSGYVVERTDDRGLADAAASILDSRTRAADMGREARAHARRSFALDRLVHELDNLYRTIQRS